MGIVDEIIVAVKALLPGLTGSTQIDYEHDVAPNNDNGYTDRFGFIVKGGDFTAGAMGFTTIDHTFQLILTDDYQNKDCDVAQSGALMELYSKAQDSLKQLQKSRLALPTPTNRVLLISGQSFEEPEFSSDNSVVVLRTNFNIRYSYQNI